MQRSTGWNNDGTKRLQPAAIADAVRRVETAENTAKDDQLRGDGNCPPTTVTPEVAGSLPFFAIRRPEHRRQCRKTP